MKDKKSFDVILLSANNNYNKLIQQAKDFKVKNVLITGGLGGIGFSISQYLIVKKYNLIIIDNLPLKKFNNVHIYYIVMKNRKCEKLDCECSCCECSYCC